MNGRLPKHLQLIGVTAGTIAFALLLAAFCVFGSATALAAEDDTTLAAGIAMMDSGSESPNVAARTKAQIINYLANSGTSMNDPTTYAVEQIFYSEMGELSDATKQSSLAMLNNVRYIAGLNEVTLNDSYGQQAQATTFANKAVGKLTHYPANEGSKPDDMPDEVWQLGITGARNSNIAWGMTLNGAIRNGWMNDGDSSNIDKVGHRRWCLNPKLGAVGFGCTDAYTAVHCHDRSGSGTQTNVVWPAQQMPVEYFGTSFPWTISTGSTISDKSTVKVVLTKISDGTTWTFDTLSTSAPSSTSAAYFNVNNDGYGQSGCIIFRPDNFSFQAGDVFHVEASGVNGKTIEYDVEFFAGYPVESASFAQQVNYLKYSTLNLSLATMPSDANNYEVVWESSDESIATVSQNGRVTRVAPGEVTITATIPGAYTTTGQPLSASTQVVVAKDIYNVNVSIDQSSLQYTGNAIAPKATVVDPDSGKTLVEGEDYTISVEGDAIEPGSQITIWIEGMNAYRYSTGRYAYVQKRTITADMVTLSAQSLTYSGSEQHPQVNVSYIGTLLAEGTDYTIAYSGGTNVGSYTATVSGVGDHYRGSYSASFSIVAKHLESGMLSVSSEPLTYNGQVQVPAVSLAWGGRTLVQETDYVLTTDAEPIAAGTYTIEVEGIGNFVGMLTRSYAIAKAAHPDPLPALQVVVPYSVVALANGALVEADNASSDPVVGSDDQTGLANWTFAASDLGTTLAVDTPVTFTASYTGADASSYNATTAQVTVTRLACVHASTELRNQREATCAQEGFSGNEYCMTCGALVRAGSSIPKLAHTYGDWAVTKAATCTEPGEKQRACSRCSAVEAEAVPALGHDYVDAVTAPTCTEGGYTTHACSRCGDSYTDAQVPAAGHSFPEGYTVDLAPTCTEAGSESIHCSVCGTHQTGSARSVAPLGHDYGAWAETKAATCTEAGERRHACSRCSAVETEVVSALGHDYVDVVMAPTCTEDGYTTHFCSRCGDSYADARVPAAGHSFPHDYTVDKAPTCTEAGSESIHCSVCGAHQDGSARDVKALGHDYKDTVVAPTCTAEGYTKHACSRCGDSHVDTKVVATGHRWGAWSVTRTATVFAAGEEKRTCSGCGNVETRAIPKLKAPTPPVSVSGQVSPFNPVSAAAVDKQVTSARSDDDQKGSTYGLLQARGVAKSKTAVKLTWKKVSGAKSYAIYGNKCGKTNKYKLITTVKGTSFTQKKLKKGTYYKYLVVALDGDAALATSKTIHVATKGGKVGNAKSVKVTNIKKARATMAVGKTLAVKTKVVAQSAKLKMKNHRKVAFETSNERVATVTAKGKIKAVGKGTCFIYAYAQNGVVTKIKVTVK